MYCHKVVEVYIDLCDLSWVLSSFNEPLRYSQMKSPGVTAMVEGKNKTLYMQTVKSIEEKTRQNLKKTLKGILYYFLPFKSYLIF